MPAEIFFLFAYIFFCFFSPSREQIFVFENYTRNTNSKSLNYIIITNEERDGEKNAKFTAIISH